MATPDILRVRLSAEGIQEVIGALKKVENETKKVKTSMSGFGGELKNMIAGLGFAAAAAQMASFVKSAIDYQDQIQGMVETTGASAEAISTLGVAARKEGVSLETLGKGMKKFGQFMLDVQRGGKGSAQTLQNLGVAAKDLVGLNLDQQFEVIAKALDGMGEEGQGGLNRTALAMEVFGKAGADLNQVLGVVATEGLANLREEGLKTGEVIDGKTALAAKNAKIEFGKLEAQVKGLTIEFSNALVPELLQLTKAFSDSEGQGKSLAATLGTGIGKTLKGLAAAFKTVGIYWAFVANEIWSGLEEVAEKFGVLWDAVAGKGKIKDVFKNLNAVGERHGQMRKQVRTGLKDELLANWEALFGEKATAAAADAGGGTGGKGGGGKIGTDKPSKAAKANIDALKSELKAFQDLNETFYKQGLIDLNTYLAAKRTAIEKEFAAELSIADPAKAKDLEIRKTAELQALEREGAKLRQDAAQAQLKLEAELEEKTTGAGQKALELLRAEYDARIKIAQGPQAKATLTELRDKAIAYEQAKQAQQGYMEIEKQLALDLQTIEQQRTLGRISDTEAMAAQTEAYRLYLDEMAKAAQAFQTAALQSGNKEMIAAADQIMLKIDDLTERTKKVKDQYAELKMTAQDALQQGLETAFMDIISGTKSVSDAFKDMARSIIQSIQQVIIKQMIMKAMQSMGGKGFAIGGPVFGPGTGTSDSIHARLSNGEYVIRAAAVKAYGSSLFSALNGIRIPKDKLPGYADGGMVGAVPTQTPARAEIGGDVNIRLAPGLMADLTNSREGKQAILKLIAENPRTVKNLLR